MKNLFVCCAIIMTTVMACADTPLVACPTGYTMKSDKLSIATTCPTGYVGKTATSCSATILGGCYMFAPTGVSYTDESGTYEYTSACAMTD
ncbi:MAG: hypothetical protein IJX89_02165 [Alphaproteobacteria bacterium]|nr:hypothetical protein [Alphaproteobacteria bacterium]